MKRIHDPHLLDLLASAWALGTLRGGARRRLEFIARENPNVRSTLLAWQGRLAAMNELQRAIQPSSAVWNRIENLIRADIEAHRLAQQRATLADKRRSCWTSLPLWRSAALAGLLLALTTTLALIQTHQTLQSRESELARVHGIPSPVYIAVLNDDRSRAAILVTFDPKREQLFLQRVADYREAPDRSLQLWALPPGQSPRSLGVLQPGTSLRWSARENEITDATSLAVSLEPAGGVPGHSGPTGPILFKGDLIRQTM